MRVLVTGAGGQLGRELAAAVPARVTLHTRDREALDIANAGAVLAAVRELAPDAVINAAAYTAVDGAESRPDHALAINADGAANLAAACRDTGARLLHVSTDFVFDGASNRPYRPADEPRPLGVYGHSKLAGERRVQEILPLRSVILRTAWVYSGHGHNFLRTMLRLMNERDSLGVVDDQRGSPTWARSIAARLWTFLDHEAAHGIYHWTDAGECSWYDFACAIHRAGRECGLIRREVSIEPLSTDQYPTPARRPAYSVLDRSAVEALQNVHAAPWQDQLQHVVREVAGQ